MSTYTEALKQVNNLKEERIRAKSCYEKDISRLDREIVLQQKIIDAVESGMDQDLMPTALGLMYVRWQDDKSFTPEVALQLRAALRDVRNGGKFLRRGFFGVKEYGPFDSQEVNCDYGFGPRFGYVWFEIGLLPAARKRDLSEHDIISLAYAIRKIQADPSLSKLFGGK